MNTKSVVIVGGGPAACTLGAYLASSGWTVVMYADPNRPALIVGESLIPGSLKVLRELGVEDSVADCAVLKRGAVLHLGGGFKWHIEFAKNPSKEFRYAYNVPRDVFDSILLRRALTAGVQVSELRAEIQLRDDGSVALVGAAAEDCSRVLKAIPDLIVDATGRARLLGKLCAVDADRCAREYSAVFSHFEGSCPEVGSGYLQMDVTENGWVWRIPLRDKLSVGVVLTKSQWKSIPGGTETRLRTVLEREVSWCPVGSCPRPVLYQNYSLISRQPFGKNWVCVGDSYGFIDPVFSSGVHLTLMGARKLARCLLHGEDLKLYADYMGKQYSEWSKLVDAFYDGRFLRMIRVAAHFRGRESGRNMPVEVESVITSVLSGTASLKEWHLFRSIMKLADGVRAVA